MKHLIIIIILFLSLSAQQQKQSDEGLFVYMYHGTNEVQIVINKLDYIGRSLELFFNIRYGYDSTTAHTLANLNGFGVISVENLHEGWPYLAPNLIKIPRVIFYYKQENGVPLNHYLYIHNHYSHLIPIIINTIDNQHKLKGKP